MTFPGRNVRSARRYRGGEQPEKGARRLKVARGIPFERPRLRSAPGPHEAEIRSP